MRFFRPAIVAMDGYTPGFQPKTSDVIKLNTNENPYPASPRVTEAIQHRLEQGLQRYPSPMADAFRAAAAALHGVTPDWVLAGNGSDDILTICTRAFIGEGQVIRTPTPSYVLYKTLAEIQGGRIELIPFQRDWSLGDDFVEDVDDNLKLAIIANPNSPSGTMLSPERVLKLATRLPCPLLVDEAYVDFADQSCLDLIHEDQRIMISRTLSKSYALAGLRFGYVIAQPHMIRELAKVKDSYNCDALSIAGATAAIEDQDWLAENRAKILAGRERLTDGMRRIGFTVADSQANFTWNTHVDWPIKVIAESLIARGIFVRYMKYEGWADGLRISVGTEVQIETCLEQIAAIVRAL